MNGEVEQESIKKKALTTCREFLGGHWKEVSLEDFKFSEVRGGFSNTLYRCSLPEDVARDSKVPTEALLRIYGPIQEDPNIVVTEAATFLLLSERKLGPKLYGLFPKGRLEEFIPSHNLTSTEMRKYSLLTAREMAKIHALDVPVKKVPDIFQTLVAKWLDEIQELLQKDKGKNFMSSNEFRKEIDWLEQEMAKSDSPVVYCHNDLQQGNILCREDTIASGKPNLTLIDFEYGSYNYRGFDIANHFAEWCLEYETPEYPHFREESNKFPSQQEQIEFFTSYLLQLSEEGISLQRPFEEEVKLMLREIPLFVCASHLFWGIWSAKMVLASTSGFSYKITNLKNSGEAQNVNTIALNSNHDSSEALESRIISAFKEYGKTRCKLYLQCKEQYLTSK